MKSAEHELAQVEVGISDLERRIVETSSRLAHEAGAFGSFQVLHFMEQTLEELSQRRRDLRQRLKLTL
jgi:hypothetical protein